MSSILDVLNEQQRIAVSQIEGPVLVYAGAGTGKTKTLTARVAYMVSECDIKPYNILAITFTKKATNEMSERLGTYLLEDAKLLNISTIHSLCVKILRKNIELLGYNKTFEILDEDDSLKVINECYKKLEIDKTFIPLKNVLNAISNYKNKCGIIPKRYQNIYDTYEQILKENSYLDFDDLLIKTLDLLKNNQNVLSYYQEYYKYILVDEFQDTNLIQYEIIKLLADKYNNLFVVGDDDQSIYSFSGATPENMISFTKDFPSYKKVILNENYRSSNIILKGANNLINNNVNREEKNLFSNINGEDDDVIIQQAQYYNAETDFVVREIKRLVREGYAEYKDIAVLYRNSALSHNFEADFSHNTIPYNIYGGFSYFKRKEVKDVITYFRFIIDPNREAHFRRIVNIEPRGIGEKTIEKILYIRDTYGISLLDSIKELCINNPSKKYLSLLDFKDQIEDLIDHVEKLSLTKFFDYFLERTNYIKILESEDENPNSFRVENVMEFKSILSNIEKDINNKDISNMERLRLGIDNLLLDQSYETTEKKDAVTLSTIHSVKGLEFKVVFVVALEEGIFPSFREDIEIEEERRVAYVAFTRAKNLLYLTCAKDRFIYGRTISNPPSRFLKEFISSNNKCKVVDQGKSITNDNEIKIASKVNHKYFGYGKVVAFDGDFYQIVFDKDNSIRKIDKNYPDLKVLK